MRTTPQSIRYAWQQLLTRAGFAQPEISSTPFETLGIKFYYDFPELIQVPDPKIIVVPCQVQGWQALLTRAEHTLYWIPSQESVPEGYHLSFSDPIPVLFWGAGYEDGRKPFAERHEDGTVIFYVDIVAATLFMLTRWEETIVVDRDEHERYPATASVAYTQGFLDRPVVDEYALILQAWLKSLLPAWSPYPHQFSIKLSHDIDFVCRASWRTLGGDLLKRRNLSLTLQTLLGIVAPHTDPYLRGLYELADLSEQNGFQSAFYFMAAQRGSFDPGYNPTGKLAQRCIQGMRDRGHEVGFHPGYATYNNAERFLIEKRRMDQALETNRYGGRQHVLRFQVPDTWRLWEQAGLAYDSTLTYADHEGFRCGTCHPYQPFDIEQDRQLDVLEIPLIVMEGTLKQYRYLTPEASAKRILALAQRCKQVNGVFTLLWHNASMHGEWAPWATMYRQILPHLSKMERENG